MSAPRKRGTSDPYRGRQVLITGGLGFLGSALARRLVAGGAKVRVMDSLLPQSGGSLRNVDDVRRDVEIVVEDIRDRDMVYRAVEGCSLVFHLAGSSGPGATQTDWYSALDIACLGTLHVLDAVRVIAPTARVVFASSHHVYGATRGAVKEIAPTEPDTLFGAHKLAAEKYCGIYGGAHGLDIAVARLATVFGPRQRVKGAPQGTILHLIDAALHGEQASVDAGAIEDLLYVDDAADVLAKLGSLPPSRARGLVVNVGSGRAVSLRDVAAMIAGRKPARGGRPAARTATWLDIAQLRKLGAEPPRRDLATALAGTLAWFRGGDTHGAV